METGSSTTHYMNTLRDTNIYTYILIYIFFFHLNLLLLFRLNVKGPPTETMVKELHEFQEGEYL